MIFLARLYHLRTDPEAQKKARIKEADERQQAILHRAFYIAGMVTFFVSAAGLLVTLPFSRTIFFTLICTMLLYFCTMVIAAAVLEKTM